MFPQWWYKSTIHVNVVPPQYDTSQSWKKSVFNAGVVDMLFRETLMPNERRHLSCCLPTIALNSFIHVSFILFAATELLTQSCSAHSLCGATLDLTPTKSSPTEVYHPEVMIIPPSPDRHFPSKFRKASPTTVYNDCTELTWNALHSLRWQPRTPGDNNVRIFPTWLLLHLRSHLRTAFP